MNNDYPKYLSKNWRTKKHINKKRDEWGTCCEEFYNKNQLFFHTVKIVIICIIILLQVLYIVLFFYYGIYKSLIRPVIIDCLFLLWASFSRTCLRQLLFVAIVVINCNSVMENYLRMILLYATSLSCKWWNLSYGLCICTFL